MLQMLTRSLVEVIKEWHSDPASAVNSPYMRIDFAVLIKHLPDTLGCAEAWQYFAEHGLVVCSLLLGEAAQQSLNEIEQAGQWRCISLEATQSFIKYLSKSSLQTILKHMCGRSVVDTSKSVTPCLSVHAPIFLCIICMSCVSASPLKLLEVCKKHALPLST